MSSSSTPPTYPNQTSDPRALSDAELLEAVSHHQPLALTEAYHRTVSAAHAVVRRLLNDTDKIEEVLTRVYSRLWAERPTNVPLEGWARAATWDIGTEVLHRDQLAPVSPSAANSLPDLPTPDSRFVDTAERAINELPDDQRTALLQAHDQGIATVEQQASDAGLQLVQALVTLAGADTEGDAELVRKYPGVADWAMGTASPTTVQLIESGIEEDQDLAELSRTLRRGRRRIEGLPATPDMGARILVSILAAANQPAAAMPQAQSPQGEPLTHDVAEGTPLGDVAETPSAALHMVDEPEQAANEDVPPALTVVSTIEDTSVDEVSPEDDAQTFGEVASIETGYGTQIGDDYGAVPLIGGDEDDSLEGGLLGDDPFGDSEAEPIHDWVPQSTDTSEMRLRDVIEGAAIEDDEDPFGDEDVSPYSDERMPRTAQSGRIADEPLSAYDDTYVRADQTAIDFDDPNAATTQFAAIGQGSEETLYDDPDTPFEESNNPIMSVLGPLLENQAVREWVLPLVGGSTVGLLLGYIVHNFFK